MTLKKITESVQRTYSAEGTTSDQVQSIQYQVLDGTNIVGSANVFTSGYSLNVNKAGMTIDELKAEFESMFESNEGIA